MKLTMQRIRTTTLATFGEWRDESGKRICYNLENTALRIEAGEYHVIRRWSVKHRSDVWGLAWVPGRSDIEIHTANLPSELLGCLAPGTEIGETEDTKGNQGYGVRHSRDALAILDDVIGELHEWDVDVVDHE